VRRVIQKYSFLLSLASLFIAMSIAR